MAFLDRLTAEILAPLAVWVFASSLDDLFLDVSYLLLWFRARTPGAAGDVRPRSSPRSEGVPSRIAIMIPCWDEASVIQPMLEHNLAAIDDARHDVWLGVYPNDQATQSRVAAVAARFGHVRFAVCPHDGPTTKADCLNSIFEEIEHHEIAIGHRYDIILQHDAEDLIHPDALRRIDEASRRYDMIQVPVFPLATPLSEFTHGTYCDFFAEFHVKELRQRAQFGGFVPSAGVGTAYRREVFDALRKAGGRHVFDEQSLTEDYAIGLRIHRLGLSQTLLHVPAAGRGGELVATRAYFPKRPADAIRQRARWVTGIALQSWASIGWRAGPGQLYWLWRDRKGLLGHPASVAANLIFCYGAARWGWALSTGGSWHFGELLSEQPALLDLLSANLVMILWRQLVRGACSWRVYGWKMALTVPLRAPWANVIDCCATLRAVTQFMQARAGHRPLRWSKTSHSYPSQGLLAELRAR